MLVQKPTRTDRNPDAGSTSNEINHQRAGPLERTGLWRVAGVIPCLALGAGTVDPAKRVCQLGAGNAGKERGRLTRRSRGKVGRRRYLKVHAVRRLAALVSCQNSRLGLMGWIRE